MVILIKLIESLTGVATTESQWVNALRTCDVVVVEGEEGGLVCEEKVVREELSLNERRACGLETLRG